MIPVAIRADASRAIGWGHVKRCLALAHALHAEGASPMLVARQSDVAVEALCEEAGVPLHWLPASDGSAPSRSLDAAQTLAACFKDHPQLIVVDHYKLDRRWHDAVRTGGTRVVVIDDLADRPLAADLLVDPNPSTDHAAKYAGVMQRDALLLGGPRYALLDPIYALQPRPDFSDEVRSIGIFMGGTDAGGFSMQALKACRASGFTGPIEIATTSGNPALADLQGMVRLDPLALITLDQPNLARFHARHDLQIGAGGSASWERCCLGVPTLALICADNQRHAVLPLAEAGLVLAVDMIGAAASSHDALVKAIRSLIDDAPLRARQAETGRTWVDGLGAARVARALLELPH